MNIPSYETDQYRKFIRVEIPPPGKYILHGDGYDIEFFILGFCREIYNDDCDSETVVVIYGNKLININGNSWNTFYGLMPRTKVED